MFQTTNYYNDWIGFVGKIGTGNHIDFPIKIMGLSGSDFPKQNQSIDIRISCAPGIQSKRILEFQVFVVFVRVFDVLKTV